MAGLHAFDAHVPRRRRGREAREEAWRRHGTCAWGGMQTSHLQPLLEFAVGVVRRARPVAQRCDRSLADQLRRSVNSVVLNLAEAGGSDPGNRRARLATARGSAFEARAAIQLAAAWGYIDDDLATSLDRDLDRLSARLYGLART